MKIINQKKKKWPNNKQDFNFKKYRNNWIESQKIADSLMNLIIIIIIIIVGRVKNITPIIDRRKKNQSNTITIKTIKTTIRTI